jgi:hypothetical protein
MLVVEAKLKGKTEQFEALDEAIRTAQFIRNSCLRYWMDNKGVTRNDLYKYCKVLADNPEFPWAKQLNSQARQADAEWAWSAIAQFFENCKKQIAGKKEYPKFKKYQTRASVEYKTTGWKLSQERKSITFTDKFAAGRFKMMGTGCGTEQLGAIAGAGWSILAKCLARRRLPLRHTTPARTALTAVKWSRNRSRLGRMFVPTVGMCKTVTITLSSTS